MCDRQLCAFAFCHCSTGEGINLCALDVLSVFWSTQILHDAAGKACLDSCVYLLGFAAAYNGVCLWTSHELLHCVFDCMLIRETHGHLT